MRGYVALFGLSCTTSAPTGSEEPAPDGTAMLSELSVEISPLVPTVAAVRWTPSTSGGRAFVEYGLEGSFDHRTPATEAGGEVRQVLLGLKEGRRYSLRAVVVDDDDNRVQSAPVTLDVAAAPADFPDFEVTVDVGEGQQPGGFFLMNIMTTGASSLVAIIDREGDLVWWFEGRADQQIMSADLGRDGESVVWLWTDYLDRTRDNGAIARLDLAGQTLTEVPATRGHHHVQEVAQGQFAWLCWSETTPVDVQGEVLPLVWDRVCETPGAVTFDFLADWGAPRLTCEHMGLDRFMPEAHEWIHANSLLYVEPDDAFLVMGRYTDSLTKIDRQTGTVVWNMGGAFNDFIELEPGSLFAHAHMSHFWGDGMLVFDNADHKGDEVSGVVEYRVDQQAMTVEAVWTYRDPLGRHMTRLGDARRLDNGNTLVVWTDFGALEEVNPDREPLWRAEAGAEIKVGRTLWIEDLYDPDGDR